MKYLFPLQFLAFLSVSITMAASSGTWTFESGGNGHFYEVITCPNYISWSEARDLAAQRGGHLATITSTAENTFITTLLPNNYFNWIGGIQHGTGGRTDDWGWLSGEAWIYTNWSTGNPNYPGYENWMQIYGYQAEQPGTWNNAADVTAPWSFCYSYVVEHEGQPTPRIFGVCIGQNDSWWWADQYVNAFRGDLGAKAVFQKLASLPAWAHSSVGNTTGIITFQRFTDHIRPQIESALQAMQVRDGDTIVFYYNGHGTVYNPSENGGETPVDVTIAGGETLPAHVGDEYITEDMSDDDLRYLFDSTINKPKWAGVFKLFLFDCCYSGGFAGTSSADYGDIEKIPNAVLLAACAEGKLAQGIKADMGVWTKHCLLPALGSGFSPTKIHDFIVTQIPAITLIYQGQNLPVLGSPGEIASFIPLLPTMVASEGTNVSASILPNVPLPSINITRQDNEITVRWPATSSGYILEWNTDLSSANWTPITSGIVLDGLYSMFIDSVPTGTLTRFYRLRRS